MSLGEKWSFLRNSKTFQPAGKIHFPAATPLTLMFRSTLLLAALLHMPFAPAQAQEPPASKERETALDDLLSERESPQAFKAVIDVARKNGISEQAILEAKFLFHVDRDEDEGIAALLPAFLKQNENFKLEDTAIFSIKEDWLAVIEYVHAIDDLQKGDRAGFKTHITEAFWLSPRQASAFAPHIERLRLNDAMSLVKINFTTKLMPLSSNEPLALEALFTGKKAMLLHFWSPASRESEESLPDFIATATALQDKGVAVVSLLTDDTPGNLTKARELLQPLGLKPPGAWLIDSKEAPLSRELRLQTYPLFILVSHSGSVLFNGDPSDDSFWEALRKVDPQIVRPTVPTAVK